MQFLGVHPSLIKPLRVPLSGPLDLVPGGHEFGHLGADGRGVLGGGGRQQVFGRLPDAVDLQIEKKITLYFRFS